MVKKLKVVVLTIIVTFQAFAVPASPNPISLSNPDGSTIFGYLIGDENFHLTVDTDRNTILEKDDAGFWVPAMRDGRRMTLRDGRDVESIRKESRTFNLTPNPTKVPMRMGMLNAEGRTTYPTVGDEEIHSLVVLIQYADTKFTVPEIRRSIDNLCNLKGYSDFDAKGSVRDYYDCASFGKFKPVFDITEPITLSQTSKHYVGSGKGSAFDYFGEAIFESLTSLHETGAVDFSKYDYDSDGIVDNIYFFFAGYGQADTGRSDCIWPHQADYNLFVDYYGLPELIFDGKKIASYACSAELKGSVPQSNQPYLAGIGTFCHEYGHVLGLPDLYDTLGGNTPTPGYWDLMAQGSYNEKSTCPPMLSAYERWVCNWIEPEIATDGSLYSLPAATSPEAKTVMIKCPVPAPDKTSSSEFFMLETRGNDSWDRSLEQHGLLIWHINYVPLLWSNNIPNTQNSPHVQIHKANNSLSVWPGPNSEYTMTYPGLSNGLIPSDSNDDDFRIFLNDIKYSELNRESSFVFNKLSDYPTETVDLDPNPTVDENYHRFTLFWTPSSSGEEEDEYMVTVKRFGTDGDEIIVDNFNEKQIGAGTQVTVGNISPSAWKQDFEAYVRIVRFGIPAKEVSNVIRFNPSKITSSVSHTKECGNELKIFSTDGVELTDTDNLPKGIYIVRNGLQTKKVLVK